MAHSLIRIKQKLCNTPHLINEQSFESIMNYLSERNNLGDIPKMEDDGPDGFIEGEYLYNEDTATAILYIEGPLTNKSTGFEALCGGTSYESLKEDFTEAVELGAKTIVFMTDSGGGEAAGMMDAGRYMRKLADDNGVRIFSYVDGGMAASAAYGLIAISDEIIGQVDSEFGSIGVLVRLMNDSKKLEQEGYERTFVTAGASKVPFAADGSFRKEFLEDIQYKVDKLYENFTSYVAEHRGMTVEAVKATEAKTFLAQDAVAIGLADAVMTIEEFYGYIAEQSQKRETPTMKNKLFKFTKQEDASEMMKLEEMQAAMSELQATLGAKEEMLAGFAEQVAQLSTQLQEKETLLAAAVAKAEEAQAASEATKKEMKLKDRAAQLAATMPADAATTMAASLEALDDSAFAGVLAGFAAQAAALQASDLFTQMSTPAEEVVEEQQEAAASVDAAKATREAMKARGL